MAKNLSVTRYEVTDLRWLIQEEIDRINEKIRIWKGFDHPPATPDHYGYLINRRRRLKKIEARLIKLA